MSEGFAAYGFSVRKDLLAQLLDLDLAVTAPGVPPGHPNPKSLITDDCIRPA